jgi:Tfp pilus assembly protein PilZ
LKAKYLLPSVNQIGDCAIVDISRGGAGIVFAQNANISEGDNIFLDLPITESEKLTLKGEVVWLKKMEKSLITGIKFLTKLDLDTFKKLF